MSVISTQIESEHPSNLSSPRSVRRGRWATIARCIGFAMVNLWLLFHCVSVILPPFSVPPSPRIVQDAYTAIRFYPQLMFLDHGYHFFGPDPGDSTLIRYVATTDDGGFVRGQIPNRRIFPRLLYHRHFMLTEAIPRFEGFDRDLHKLQIQTYAARLRRSCDAQSVELYRVTHRIAEVERFLAGHSLDDPDSYIESSLGNFSWPDLSALSANR